MVGELDEKVVSSILELPEEVIVANFATVENGGLVSSPSPKFLTASRIF